MIELINNYYIDADDNQFILKIKTKGTDKNTGNPVYKTVGYYTTISSAISGAYKALSREHVQNIDTTLYNAVIELQGIEKRIQELVNV